MPLPPGAGPIAEILLNRLSQLLARRHGTVLDRLAEFAGTRCLIVAQDMPYPLLLTLQTPPAAPRVTLLSPRDQRNADAVIRADILTLLRLLQGKLDGDALFFSRDLIVEGDMNVVVALRNAVDEAGIDLIADIAAQFGPLAAPAERIARRAIGLVRTIRRPA
jgi:predicted lipid carrier protein YhbT